MTQYPNPYQPPSPGFDQYRPAGADPLAPARRASIMLFVLGGLGLACGLGLGTMVWMAPTDVLVKQLQATMNPGQLSQLPPGWTIETFAHVAYTAAAILIVVGGIVMLLVGFFARRGGRGASVAGIVICALVILWLAVNLVGSLVQTLRAPGAQAAGAVVFGVVCIAAFALTLAWLVQAARAAPMVAWNRQRMQAQYGHYEQQYAAYQQPAPPPPGYGYGYGYGAVPPPPQAPAAQPPPGPLPPPADPSGDSHGDRQA